MNYSMQHLIMRQIGNLLAGLLTTGARRQPDSSANISRPATVVITFFILLLISVHLRYLF